MFKLVIILTFLVVSTDEKPCYVQPEQIHISYGGSPTQMWITWVTFDPLSELPSVESYASHFDLDPWYHTQRQFGKTYPFHMHSGRTLYVHRVLLMKAPETKYVYHVGSKDGWSNMFSFHTFPLKPPSSGYRFAVFGDMGSCNARLLGHIQQEAQRGKQDMALHIGDFAYDLNSDNGMVGDQFMRQIEPIAAYIPYMTMPGNHENAENFSHYTHRFNMPGPHVPKTANKVSKNIYYSFDLGLAHFIGISTELYFFTNYGTEQVGHQYKWLENDLKKANKNRHKVPWIITMGHRPMYCSNSNSDDCTKYESITRTGGSKFKKFGLEKLFYKQGVDLTLWGHEHSYERLWPIYNRTVYNGTKHQYKNPPAPVHVTTGIAGCKENHDPFGHQPPFSAHRSSDYGYARMIVKNHSHLYFEQFFVDKEKVIDHFWFIKDKHGPYSDKERAKVPGVYVPCDYVAPGQKSCKHCDEV